jgi:hydrogenase maturation protease
MSRVLIIGFGNPLRGDDGAGWHAAERLRDIVSSPEIEIRAVHQLAPEIAEDLSRADTAIFIDAAVDLEPGAVHRRRVTPVPVPTAFTHFASPTALLGSAQALYGRAPEAHLYTIGVASLELGERLSPAVEQAVARVIEEIRGVYL